MALQLQLGRIGMASPKSPAELAVNRAARHVYPLTIFPYYLFSINKENTALSGEM